MKNTILVLAGVLLSISSCKDPRQIIFAGTECIQLGTKDQVMNINAFLKDYEPFSQIGEINIPLTRVIKSDTSLMYIGLAQTDRLEELKLNSGDREIISEKQIQQYYVNIERIVKKSVVRIFYEQSEIDMIVVVNIEFLNEKYIDEYLSDSNRIQTLFCEI